MTGFPNAFVAVRDIVPGQRTDPGGAGYDPRAGGPVVPASWGVSPQGDTGWYMITTGAGVVIAAFLVNAIGGRGLFSLHGPKAVLDAIAAGNAEVMSARRAWRLRAVTTSAAGEASPNQICRAWRVWRCTVVERDESGTPITRTDVVRTLSAVGVLLPATSLPWNLAANGTVTTQALAVRRVTAISRPALLHTLAGWSLHETLEAEEDV